MNFLKNELKYKKQTNQPLTISKEELNWLICMNLIKSEFDMVYEFHTAHIKALSIFPAFPYK